MSRQSYDPLWSKLRNHRAQHNRKVAAMAARVTNPIQARAGGHTLRLVWSPADAAELAARAAQHEAVAGAL